MNDQACPTADVICETLHLYSIDECKIVLPEWSDSPKIFRSLSSSAQCRADRFGSATNHEFVAWLTRPELQRTPGPHLRLRRTLSRQRTYLLLVFCTCVILVISTSSGSLFEVRAVRPAAARQQTRLYAWKTQSYPTTR